MDLIIIFGAVILVWLAILTVFVVRIFAQNRGKSKDINKRIIDEIKSNELRHIQKIAMLRFNPFNESGGDSSFTIALLDGKSDGIVLTGLHTREKTRVYAKKIMGGKSEYELSGEEKKAISEALK